MSDQPDTPSEAAPETAAPSPALPDAAELAASERFFCAQHALAPRVLARWYPPPAHGRELPGSVLMAHFDDRGALEAFLRELRVEALRQGADLQSSEPVAGILVIRVGKG